MLQRTALLVHGGKGSREHTNTLKINDLHVTEAGVFPFYRNNNVASELYKSRHKEHNRLGMDKPHSFDPNSTFREQLEVTESSGLATEAAVSCSS
jgi:hypothetical protein